jgi:hyperosmotically inducible periplasmic protein
MSKMRWKAIGLAFGATLAIWTCVVQAQQESATQKAKEALGTAVGDLKKGVQNVSEGVRERFSKARTSVQNMGIEARVYGRLHWDKALNTASIELEMHDTGTVTMRGTVPDPAAKAKAITLAKDTVGVTQVIDQLTALSPTSPAPSPVPAKTAR